MRKRLMSVYGGTNLTPGQVEFVSYLTRAILSRPENVLVTGGFHYRQAHKAHQSTDRTVAEAARDFLEPDALPARLETWLPEHSLDRRKEHVVRFSDIGTVKRLKGKSDLARRFFLTNGVDALVTIAGEGNTRMVLELASTISKPALPLPFTGQDSRQFWKGHKAEILKRFAVTEKSARELEGINLDNLRKQEKRALAEKVAGILQGGLRKRCLILMHFDEKLNHFYAQLKETVEEAGFESMRIDRSVTPGHIRGLFHQQLLDCEKILADVTEINPNVMYEIGHAHALGVEPFLFCRKKLLYEQIPFYLREYKLESPLSQSVRARGALMKRIKTYLANAG